MDTNDTKKTLADSGAPMADIVLESETTPSTGPVQMDASVLAPALDISAKDSRMPQRKFTNERPPKNARKGGPKGGSREPRAKPEFDQKMISIRRVTRVVSGGRRFSFSVALVAGNRKGSVGVGTGKASDTSLAIDKAARNAKRNMIKLNLTKDMSIKHDVTAKYSSAIVTIRPAKGRGMVAGSSVRNVLELAGVRDVTAKIFSGSKNHLNIARVAIKALQQLGTPKAGAMVANTNASPLIADGGAEAKTNK
jgi:small subunit ribosomal protein S5